MVDGNSRFHRRKKKRSDLAGELVERTEKKRRSVKVRRRRKKRKKKKRKTKLTSDGIGK
jgi:hypothetical protein